MHEKSIHIGLGGRWFILPTVIEGKEHTPEQAVEEFKKGHVRPLGEYSTEIEARREAEKRSRKEPNPNVSW